MVPYVDDTPRAGLVLNCELWAYDDYGAWRIPRAGAEYGRVGVDQVYAGGFVLRRVREQPGSGEFSTDVARGLVFVGVETPLAEHGRVTADLRYPMQREEAA